MLTLASLIVGLAIAAALTYAGRPWQAWLAGWLPPLARWAAVGGGWGLGIAIAIWLAVAIATGVPEVRRRVLTGPALRRFAASFPRTSETERVAIDAGTVWWDAELFGG